MKIEINGMTVLSEYAEQQNKKYAEQLKLEEMTKEEYDNSLNQTYESKVEISDSSVKGKIIFSMGYSDKVEIDIEDLKRAMKIF